VLFTNLHVHPDLLKGIRELGFTRPTPIQAEAVPPALNGRDLLACAQTGSGKTIAFLLPVLHRLMDRPRRTTRALVLTPTRELAAQILEEFNALTIYTPLTGAAVFGGVGMGPQTHAFRSGVDLIVATPGRLLDHMTHPYATLSGLECLVLDEADRMLDMGFLPDIKRILRRLPARRQTLFFSATMPKEIAALASEMLTNPVAIALQRQAAPAVGITQSVYPVPQHLKPALLLELLTRGLVTQALVFTRTKHRANRLAESLVRGGIKAERIHGNRSQAQRTLALAAFKDGRLPVLVATDIAARGIDVEALRHVVNFDVPAVPEDYIHRVGRTGRAEMTGEAFTFVSPEEEPALRAIRRAIGQTLPRVTLPEFNYSAQAAHLEVPRRERIAIIRQRKREERERAAINAALRAAARGAGAGHQTRVRSNGATSTTPHGTSHQAVRHQDASAPHAAPEGRAGEPSTEIKGQPATTTTRACCDWSTAAILLPCSAAEATTSRLSWRAARERRGRRFFDSVSRDACPV
jgi:ATP-dependent RNA helicase RhlE